MPLQALSPSPDPKFAAIGKQVYAALECVIKESTDFHTLLVIRSANLDG